jgi:hypothetical protein
MSYRQTAAAYAANPCHKQWLYFNALTLGQQGKRIKSI